MSYRLQEAYGQKTGNYILPFLWLHGEDEGVLREGMQHVQESGIGAVCLESRPHPDFLGEKWWQDVDVIMDEARKRSMKVWVLDDAHFPTGWCNGMVGDASPYAKEYLACKRIDAAGPVSQLAFPASVSEGERLIGAVLLKRSDTRENSWVRESACPCIEQDGVIFPRPDAAQKRLLEDTGLWTLFILKVTRNGSRSARKNYLNLIDRKAVRFFLDTVYEPFYARYGEDFGKTFAGFFFDEPEIGNGIEEHDHHVQIGQPDIFLPWCGELEEDLRRKWGEGFLVSLASLWLKIESSRADEVEEAGLYGDGVPQAKAGEAFAGVDDTAYREARVEFMDLLTDLYRKNFSGQVGEWCRAHGVMSIGHVIEDDGRHFEMGLGTGHYFRALSGQDMSGIDIVLQQYRPEMDVDHHVIGGTSTYRGEFYHYLLAKLAVSAAQNDPKKAGRAMCEIFGAYGWAEGIRLMKQLLDHMLAEGVNHFVPHAFTLKPFPDLDCPPHFYAWGMNPQFPYFKLLMEYTNRVCHLLSGARLDARVGLLYAARQEWAEPVRREKQVRRRGVVFDTGNETMESLAACLTKEHIPFTVVSEDDLESLPGGLKALVVLGSEWIDFQTMARLEKLSLNGLHILFCPGRPVSTWKDGYRLEGAYAFKQVGKAVSREKLADRLRRLGCAPYRIEDDFHPLDRSDADREEKPAAGLRCNPFSGEDMDFLMFYPEKECDTSGLKIRFNRKVKGACWYQPWENKITEALQTDEYTVSLSELDDFGLSILCLPKEKGLKNWLDKAMDAEEDRREARLWESWEEAAGADRLVNRGYELTEEPWRVELKAAGEDRFRDIREIYAEAGMTPEGSGIGNLLLQKPTARFSGTVRYTLDYTPELGIWRELVGTGSTEEESAENGAFLREERLPKAAALLRLGVVGEIAEVFVNGVSAGVKVNYPYDFPVGHLLKPGVNHFEVVVTNTLVYRERDYCSESMPLEPSGLAGPVDLVIMGAG